MVTLFTEPTERAKTMGVFGFVAAGGLSYGRLHERGRAVAELANDTDAPRQS